MNREEKNQEVERLKQDFQKISSAFLVDFRGMKVVDATDLRRQIHKSHGHFKVIKNTLATLAAKDLPLNVLEKYFEGPTGIAFTEQDAAALAKVLNTISKDNPNLVIKAGYLEGTLIEGKRISEIANMPSRAQLQAQFVGLVASPLRRLLW